MVHKKFGKNDVEPLNPFAPRLRLGKTTRGCGILIILLSFLATGCGTVPPRNENLSAAGNAVPSPDATAEIKLPPPPIPTFPPVKPGMIRLPIVITFPQGGGLFQHIANLVKGGIKQVAQETILKSRMRALWAKMESPIRMDKDLWLLIRPESLSVGKMRTDLKQASTLHAVLEMVASPEICFGPMPLTTPVEMPPLQPFQPGPGIFQAMTNTHINYEDANRYFRDPRMKIIGKVLPSTGERKLTIEGIRLSGSGGKVIVEVKLHYNPLIINLGSKPADLTLYLRGTPRYLPKRQVFDLPDLEYDIKSSDLMLQVADFIFKSDFKNQLRRVAIVPVGLKMDILKAKINKKLNRSLGRFTHVRTQVNSFEILDGYADNKGLEMRGTLKGTATLQVIWR
jgi:hypothetical protein